MLRFGLGCVRGPADGSDFLFTSQKGGRLDRTAFFRLFKAVARAAGMLPEKCHPHCLKHSLASHLVAGNVNLALIKQAFGRRSINSTMQYFGTTDSQAAAEPRFDGALLAQLSSPGVTARLHGPSAGPRCAGAGSRGL